MSFWDDHPDRLERFAPFRRYVDELARLERGEHRAGYARTTGPLTELSYDELVAARDAGHPYSRPRHWREAKRQGSDPELGNAHAARTLQRLSRGAGDFFGATTAATVLHDLAARGGYRVEIPAALRDGPEPTGPTASSIVGYFDGMKPAGRRTWQLWKRATFRTEPVDL